MQVVIGWVLIIIGGALYLAQIISSVNFPLAQRLGIQEKPDTSDAILQRAERYTAYWDILTLLWLPVAGILMVTDHHWWPVVSLFGGAIYLDTAGREAAKNLSFQHEGIKVGTDLAFVLALTYVVIKEVLYNKDFVTKNMSHFEEYKKRFEYIDSLIWQVAEGIYKHRENRSEAMSETRKMLQGYGAEPEAAGRVARELTHAL